MNATNSSALDADELLHLAVAASNRNEADQAISLLKRAVATSPSHANAHYLLGAEHAQIGMFERAISDMRTAIELDPNLNAARFQLGMLLMTSRQVEAAETVWQPLDALGSDHFYALFKTGLLQLARDEFDACLASLRSGLITNQVNQPLNADMQRIIQQVEGLSMKNGNAGADGTKPEANSESGHLFINAYTDQRRK